MDKSSGPESRYTPSSRQCEAKRHAHQHSLSQRTSSASGQAFILKNWVVVDSAKSCVHKSRGFGSGVYRTGDDGAADLLDLVLRRIVVQHQQRFTSPPKTHRVPPNPLTGCSRFHFPNSPFPRPNRRNRGSGRMKWLSLHYQFDILFEARNLRSLTEILGEGALGLPGLRAHAAGWAPCLKTRRWLVPARARVESSAPRLLRTEPSVGLVAPEDRMNGISSSDRQGQAQAMERARAIFSAIREWLFSQGANAQGEGPGDVTHPVSHEAMLQVPSASLLPPLANPIGAARSLKHFHMCRHRTHTVARPADLQESRALVSLPDWHTSSGVGEQFLDTRWEPRLTYEEKQWTLKSWPSRSVHAPSHPATLPAQPSTCPFRRLPLQNHSPARNPLPRKRTPLIPFAASAGRFSQTDRSGISPVSTPRAAPWVLRSKPNPRPSCFRSLRHPPRAPRTTAHRRTMAHTRTMARSLRMAHSRTMARSRSMAHTRTMARWPMARHRTAAAPAARRRRAAAARPGAACSMARLGTPTTGTR